MARIGSDNTFSSNNRGGVIDDQGNSVVSASTDFGASPAGKSLATQILFGLPNGTFDLLPPDPSAIIVANQNPLPYWDVQNISTMAGSAVYDSTTLNWGINLNPGTAGAGDSITMTTRSYLINDDNLGLRQKAFAVVSKVGTYAGTSQWNMTLTATYYDDTDTLLSTQAIGTVYDNTTWTSMSGFTTAGGSAIIASASYVDLQFTLTATAAVTSATSVTIKSCLLSTKVGATGSFLIAETFTASTTWTRPTGVDNLVALVIAGGGGGGGGGQIRALNTTTTTFQGSSAGAGGNWWIVKDLYVGDQTTISVGIGAGGAGGTAQTATKAPAVAGTIATPGADGAAGGNTTFGSYVTAFGGGGGTAGSGGGAAAVSGGAVGAATTSTVWLGTSVSAGAGGNGGGAASAVGNGGAGGFSTYTTIPYSPAIATSAAGGTGSGTGGTQVTGALGSPVAGWIGGGGGSGGGTAQASSAIAIAGNGNYGGGAGAASRAIWISTASATVSGTAGQGGAGVNAAGGGGGGALALATSTSANYTSATLTLASGAGGAGASGFVTVVYVA